MMVLIGSLSQVERVTCSGLVLTSAISPLRKGRALFVALPPSPFDSPATSYKLASSRRP
jgi:hypothetical protein